jgi:hypothetical protein
LLQRIVSKPESVCLTSDEDLHRLADGPPLPPLAQERVFGEVLFRRWLYEGGDCPSGVLTAVERASVRLKAFVIDELLPGKRLKDEEALVAGRRTEAEKPCGAERWLCGRILTFRRAEGLVAVVQNGEAYPVPFRVEAPARDEPCFRDAGGSPVLEWEREAEAVWQVTERYSVMIDLNLEAAAGAGALKGGSFALPLLLAARYDNQRFFDPLSVLVTGALRNGCVVPVESVEAKLDLARRMGVGLFAAPCFELSSADSGMQIVGIPPGTRWQEAMEQLNGALQKAGLCSLSVPLARRGIAMLTRGTATGRIANTKARVQCEMLLAFLRSNFHPVLATSIHHGELLLAAIDNHEGFPERAMERLQRLIRERRPEISSQELLSTMTHLSVSLCDSGRLEESAALGRLLVHDVDALFPEETDKGLEMRARVYGAAGGQGMLQLALRTGNPSLAIESLQLLIKSRDISERLCAYDTGLEGPVDYAGWVSRGYTQAALWQALFSPDSTQNAVEEAEAKLPRQQDDVSGDFLRRVRFLGAYRGWLTSGHVPQFGDWELELPDRHAPAWILATSLKYRGSLRAANGEFEGARADFLESLAILNTEDSEVLRVIAWSTAMQALQFPELGHTADLETFAKKRLPCVLKYLRASPSCSEICKSLENQPHDLALARRFQMGFPY